MLHLEPYVLYHREIDKPHHEHTGTPLYRCRAQEKARVFHLEALDVSQSILEDLLQSLATPVAAAQNELTGTTSQEIEPSGELEEKPKG